MESNKFTPDFPAVLKNKISNWKVLNYTTEDWCNLFKEKLLKFRQGKKTYLETPNWERLCEVKEMTMRKFFEISSQNSDYWLYFDYKYVKDVFLNNEGFTQNFRWSDVGLLDQHGEESALWIGSKGAHTPCHKDTYGCNFVAQIFGRKRWILMPPKESENLKPVRVPYEESSVYSGLNFYTPNKSLLDVKEAFGVVLSPGDVLYVPRHWWHYVENIEPAISINVWIPLNEDHESRLEESLVQYYVSNICQDLTEEEAKQLLNPNEFELISNPCTLNLVEKCLENYKKSKPLKGNEIINKIQGDIERLEKLNMESYLQEKTMNTPVREKRKKITKGRVSIAETLINSYCRQDNINAIKKALLE